MDCGNFVEFPNYHHHGFIWGKGSYGGRDQETGWLIGLALELKMA